MTEKKYPETSYEARKSLDPIELAKIYREILFALSKLGEGTFEDIAAYMKVNPSRVWKRMSELHKADLVYRPGNKRMLKSNRMGFTWMLTNGTTPKTTKAEKLLAGKSVVDYSKTISSIQSNLF